MAWRKAISLGELRREGVKGVEIDGRPVALYRLGDEVFASHGICTHALAFLADGFVEDGKIECPLHQGLFDIRSGRALCSPVAQDLKTYAVKIEDGDVFVDLDETGRAESEEQRKQGDLASSMSSDPVVIVGAGQAAAAAIRSMRASGFEGAIELVGREERLPYERPPLSKDILLGKASIESCARLSDADVPSLGVKVHLGCSAVQVDPDDKIVSLSDGAKLRYSALLFATGGLPRQLPMAKVDLPGVHYLRTIEDAHAIRQSLANGKRLVIVGGGFIGLELASVAATLGLSTVVLEREAELMARVLPPSLGRTFRALAERHGVSVRRKVDVRDIRRDGARIVVDTSGGILEADIVCIGVGLAPETEVAAAAGCDVDGGIVVDEEQKTSVAGIWAAGDCALYHRPIRGRRCRLESWHNAEQQGAAAGRSIAGLPPSSDIQPPWFWTDQFGLNIQILGVSDSNDQVALTGNDGEPGAVYRTIDPDTGWVTSVIAFSDPAAIRQARKEFADAEPFDAAKVSAVLLTGDSKKEDKQVKEAPVSTISKHYVWPSEGLTRVPDWVYTDSHIYQREVEKIFHGRTWNYVALESEIPNAGDFIRSNVGPTPVVVSRAEDGSINVFENRCAHRAAEFCRELSGNAKEFVCPYHQWSYDLKGNLSGVPFRRGVDGKGGMPREFKNADHGLRQLNVTAHRGVVFASYCADMEPLAEYLGSEILREFEATFDGRTPKVLGHYRHSLPGNWKLYHENLKDPYHATLLHTFLVTFGLLVAGNKSSMIADASGRHGVMASAKSDASKLDSSTKKEMRAYKEGMQLEEPRFMDFVNEFDSPWSVTMTTIWPNLIVQREMNTLGVRQIVPTGPNEFIMKWTMFGFEGDDEEMTRHRLRQGNLMGPAGFLGLEDNEAIKFVQDGMLSVPDGQHVVELDPGVIGTADTLISEASIRAMYQHWRSAMEL
ncbi:phenylpropionate dioxygenase-like ring-hydroxylating dioxygenase large terminal subunit/NADPH-dependent 2,4-dienoyl-CoA reductase/sulfur reductase-like enzyme [Bradyrhizobium sp. USDA 4509]